MLQTKSHCWVCCGNTWSINGTSYKQGEHKRCLHVWRLCWRWHDRKHVVRRQDKWDMCLSHDVTRGRDLCCGNVVKYRKHPLFMICCYMLCFEWKKHMAFKDALVTVGTKYCLKINFIPFFLPKSILSETMQYWKCKISQITLLPKVHEQIKDIFLMQETKLADFWKERCIICFL